MTTPDDAREVPLEDERAAEDRDEAWGDRRDDDATVRRLLDDRPPHHGD